MLAYNVWYMLAGRDRQRVSFLPQSGPRCRSNGGEKGPLSQPFQCLTSCEPPIPMTPGSAGSEVLFPAMMLLPSDTDVPQDGRLRHHLAIPGSSGHGGNMHIRGCWTGCSDWS